MLQSMELKGARHNLAADSGNVQRGFPGGVSGEELACQRRRHKRHRFTPWVGKIPLEEEMTTHSSILAWRISWTGSLEGYSPEGHKKFNMTDVT